MCQGSLVSACADPSRHQVSEKQSPDGGKLREELLKCEDCGTHYVKQVRMNAEGVITMAEVKPAQEAEQDVDKKLNRSELLEKLRRLEELKRDVETQKRTATKDYNDQLKDIEGEIADVLELLKNKEASPPPV